MASSKEIQQSSRPLTYHRSSPSANSSAGLPGRTHSRTNSHPHSSLLTGAINSNHRVTRRKSVTNPKPDINALAAALREDMALSSALPISYPTGRRNTVSRATVSPGVVESLPSPPASLPNKSVDLKRTVNNDSAIDDHDGSADETGDKATQARVRRASEDQSHTKDGKKSNRIEVRCDTCGKSYKHSSCLTKHLWEHTPQWSMTSKLLISKHQQVQLLEAASVLVAMNGKEGSPTPPGSAKDFLSDTGSVSPDPSGASDLLDRQSSAETTPPPAFEVLSTGSEEKLYNNTGSFSHSYRLTPSAGFLNGGEFASEQGSGHGRRNCEMQSLSLGLTSTGNDDRELAAAVELLSCSLSSNSGSRGTVTMVTDAPPVPPVPAQYRNQATSFGGSMTGSMVSFINSFPRQQPESFTRSTLRRGSDDIKMGETQEDDDDFDMRSRARSDEEDDGVFGRMEE